MKHSRCRKFLFVTVVLSTTNSLVSAFMPSTSSSHATISSPPSFCRFILWATDNDNDNYSDSNDSNKNKQNQVAILGKQQGVYSRPSAAIERGSGFFIPGLEGPKIRLVVGLVLLAATVLNHASSITTTTTTTTSSTTAIITTMSRGNVLAESLAVLTSLLVLLQASVEAVQEQQANIQIGSKQQQQQQKSTVASSSSSSSSSTLSTLVTEAWSATNRSIFDIDNDTAAWRERVAWSARTYLALTAATQMFLIGPTGVLYRLSTSTSTTTTSNNNNNNNDKESGKSTTTNDNDTTEALAALWETLQQSTSGRVALPTGHATAQTLAPGQECVVVQRIIRDKNDDDDHDDMFCWMVTSPKSLASTLTQRDLRWLGPLAHYVGSGTLS